MRDRLRADFKIKAEVITPLVIAGADNSRDADIQLEGLRPPSLRGAMRWWFRAMMGGIVGKNKMKALESEVFGSTERASSVRIRTYPRKSNPGKAHLCMNDAGGSTFKGNRRANIRRPAFLEGSEFDLCIRCEFGSSSIVLGSLWLLAVLGGVGARVRRGFGSLAMSPEDEATEKVLEDFGLSFSYPDDSLEKLAKYLEESLKEIKSCFQDFASRRSTLGTSSPVRFPVLSASRAKLWLIKPQDHWWPGWNQAMEELRKKIYRDFKKNPCSFELDASGFARDLNKGIVPDRLKQAFYRKGYPLSQKLKVIVGVKQGEIIDGGRRFIVRLIGNKLKVKGQWEEIGSASPRLASPLIIQIKRTEGGKYFGVLLAFDEGINPSRCPRYLGKNCGDFTNFLSGIKGFECREVVLP